MATLTLDKVTILARQDDGKTVVEVTHQDYGALYTINLDDRDPDTMELALVDDINGNIIDQNTLDKE